MFGSGFPFVDVTSCIVDCGNIFSFYGKRVVDDIMYNTASGVFLR